MNYQFVINYYYKELNHFIYNLQSNGNLSENLILWEWELNTQLHQISNTDDLFKESNSWKKNTHSNFKFVFEKMKRKWGSDTVVYTVYSVHSCGTSHWIWPLDLIFKYSYSGFHDSEFSCYYYYCIIIVIHSLEETEKYKLWKEHFLLWPLITGTWTKLLKCDAFNA